MSDFENAYLMRCPYCGTKFASCEGPDCNCLDDYEDDKPEYDPKEDDPLIAAMLDITRIQTRRIL